MKTHSQDGVTYDIEVIRTEEGYVYAFFNIENVDGKPIDQTKVWINGTRQ